MKMQKWGYFLILLIAICNAVTSDIYSDVYDDDIFVDKLERLRRAADNCDEAIPAPSGGSADRIYSTSARISWSSVDEAEWYTVAVSSPDSACVRGEGDVFGDESTHLTLRDLDSETNYVITVIAHHVNGCSVPKEIYFSTAPGSWKCEGSSEEPGDVTGLVVPVENITSDRILITWTPTPMALQYKISIDKSIRKYGGLGFMETESCVITRLKPGSLFKVEIQAVNGKYIGPLSSIDVITKLEVPNEFMIQNVSSSFLQVYWDIPELSTYSSVVLYGFDNSGETFEQTRQNVSSNFVYFSLLNSATKYKVSYQAFNIRSSSLILTDEVYTKLPTTSEILISNVTDHSVFSQWEPVSGATKYRIILKDYQNEVVKNLINEDTSYMLEGLKSAEQYQLLIIALNDVTESLPGSKVVYTRLNKVKFLNVDKAHIQDTYLVLRWAKNIAANWYEVKVSPKTPGVNFTGEGDVERVFTRIGNLTPGTKYTISVSAINFKEFDTGSNPAVVEQFTKLSRPLNFTVTYSDITHSSMRVTWSKVKHAASYFLLAFDCSGRGRTVRKKESITTTTPAPTSTSPMFDRASLAWVYSYPKIESIKLKCEPLFDDVLDAIRAGEKQKPSDVVGQGRTVATEQLLTGMRPGTKYEIIVVAGMDEIQSFPSRILKYTKLEIPGKFRVDSNTVRSSSLYLRWMKTEGAEYYKLDIWYTPIATNQQKKRRKLPVLKFVRTTNVTGGNSFVSFLEPTTNYTFVLTAYNKNTRSFPVSVTRFTLLPSPPTLNVVPEMLTTDTILLQWTPVSNALVYVVSFVPNSAKVKRQLPHFKNVTSPEIFLEHLAPNTMYQITIMAQNRFTKSLSSKVDTFTELPTPSNFTVVEVTDTKIILTWDDVEGRKNYKLNYAKYPSEPETFRYTATDARHEFDFLSPNTPFRIWMKASNENTESEVSEIIQYTRLPIPQQVRFIEIADNKLRIKWQTVTDASLYNIVIVPLFNESEPNADIDEESLTDVITVSKTNSRKKRVAPEIGKKRVERVRREGTGNLDAQKPGFPSYIDFRARPRKGSRNQDGSKTEGERGSIFPGPLGVYYVNVTFSDVAFAQLEAGVKYKFTLVALNSNIQSLPISRIKFTELQRPQSVEIKEITNDTMIVRWLTVWKATYYQVLIVPEVKSWMMERSAASGIGNTTNTEVSIKGLIPNTNYTITILAGNNHVVSKKSVIWKITKLSPIENLRIIQSSVKHDRFHIKWNKVAYAHGYVVVVSPPTLAKQSRISVTGGATEFNLQKLKYGTKYYVTVSGENLRTGGMEQTVIQYTKLLSPKNLKIVNGSVTFSSFTIKWSPVPNADEYHVVIGNRTNSEAREIIVNRPVAEIKGLGSGQEYRATVSAHNTNFETFSDTVTVQLFTKLETPTNFDISHDDLSDVSMTITWDSVPLATRYLLTVGIEHRENDHYSVYLKMDKQKFQVSKTFVFVGDLFPASYYLITMKAVNKDTESFTVSLYQFTKLPHPKNITLLENFYMDTEAEIDWQPVEEAEFYMLEIYQVENVTRNDTFGSGEITLPSYIGIDDKSVNYDNNGAEYEIDVSDDPNTLLSLVRSPIKVEEFSYNTVTGLIPLTDYMAVVKAVNVDTDSDGATMKFKTKSSCVDDYHHFPNTHLSQTLPRRTITNSTVASCLRACCLEREFNCRSVSLHRTSSACLIFAEDRNTAPPLAISRSYDHYERKFWKEVSGFQIRSLTHNNVAVMNETVELTVTFVYLGKGGCVTFDFGDGSFAYSSILDSNCSYLCENSDDKNCTIFNSDPNQNANQITTSHDYDMETVFTARVNVTDGSSTEEAFLKIAINERGCIFPAITIEDDGKIILDPKKMYRSSKMVVSATPVIVCKSFPGVRFEWGAVSYAADRKTPTDSFSLKSSSAEILVPALTFPLGFYRVSVSISLLDEKHDLEYSDAMYVLVGSSPLVAKIKGGTMRTVGARRHVTWDSSSVSYDPDIVGKGNAGLKFDWFCRNYTDKKFLPLQAGSCFSDMKELAFDGPGVFTLNTSLMHLYEEYEFRVVVSKEGRSSQFKQQIIVKEGDPPDMLINCAENCKAKMNPTQAIALQAVCRNCKPQRDPRFKWRLFEVVEARKVAGQRSNEDSQKPTVAPSVTQAIEAPKPNVDAARKVTLNEVFGWENVSTTGSNTSILVLNKNALIGGKKYIFRVNVTMEGLDDRVFSVSDFVFLTNLPPYGGVCTTSPSIGNCDSFIHYPESHLVGVPYRQILFNTTMEKCSEYCCLTREFMCLSLSFNEIASECYLYECSKDSTNHELEFEHAVHHYHRLFYRGGAVVDEVVLECRGWKDEGDLLSYPKPGQKVPKTSLSYKFTTLPKANQTKGLLLYFGNVPKTPGVSMALGDPNNDFSVSVIAQVCDFYGECALSNVISLQIYPPDSNNMGSTLSGFTNGNASKLAILSNTGNSKAAAQLVQSISSLININEEESALVFNTTKNYTTAAPYTTTVAPTTAFQPTTASVWSNNSHNATGIGKDEKINLRSDIVNSLSSAAVGMTSIDNLQQMSSAMSAITMKTDEIDSIAQQKASSTVKEMAGTLSGFSKDSNKEDVTSAANNLVGSLGSVAKASETDMSELQKQMLEKTEIDYNTLDERDLSPDEFEYYHKKKLKEEKRRVRRSALGSQEVVGNAMAAIGDTANALLGKQMEGENPVDVSSNNLEMKVEKTSPSELSGKQIATSSGASLKLPDAAKFLGKDSTNSTEPVDMQVTAFTDNPFGFGEDAAFINSPVTMLKIGTGSNDLTTNDTENSEGDKKDGVGISVPSKFDALNDMVTVVKDINDTGLSISKFEVKTRNNAILIIVEPEDHRAEFDVFIRHELRPTEEEFDYKFELPKDLWDVDHKDDLFEIFISERDVIATGVFYIGIKDKLNITAPLPRGRVRRRRSIGYENSTTYHLLIATPGCRRFDQELKAWTGDGCVVDERSTPEVTECFCTKLSPTSIFSAEFFVPPNTINFATVWAKIDISDNPAVFSTVISFIIWYILMLIWAARMDRKDARKWSLKSTLDNRKEDRYLYQVTVFTGHGRNASTHSKVSCVLFGDQGKTKVRSLAIKEDKTPFTRSSVNHFILRESKPLGDLTHVHIWHDNTGKGENRSWYLDQVVVQDVRTGKRFFFICDQWLAVDFDDGKVDRILPCATPENMSTFHRLFVSTTTQKFTEDHLWVSLFYRPTKSNFTRKQRLSCCMALLFMTMIANAMFFESGKKSDKSGTATIKLGPLTISPLQIWTSFCSTLLVVPITTIIMLLFKKAKTKEQEKFDKEEKETIQKAVEKFNRKMKMHSKAASLPEPSELMGCEAVYTINVDGTINPKANIARADQQSAAQWPHWCVYLAWTITTLAVLISGFFAILYSFEWGRDKAERWLSNMMLSFWQSVLIVQPIKVIVLAMFVATVIKKPDHQALNTIDAREVKEADREFINLCAENIESELQEKELTLPPKPPSKRKLRKARKLRQNEKKMSEIVWELITYILYIFVLLFICHGNRDQKGQRITQQMKSTFVESKYGLKSVSSVEYFWRFVNVTLLPNLYSDRWYNGEKKNWRDRNFLSDDQSYRVGPARLRQIRIDGHKCAMGVGNSRRSCRGHFEFFHEETTNFAPGWRSIENYTIPEEEKDDPLVLAWLYKDWMESKGVLFIGELAVYPGGGYSAELGVNFETGQFVVDQMFKDAWIDDKTRAVFAEFTLYNPSANLFTGVQLLSEFPPVGATETFTSIMTFRLYQYIGAYGTLMITAQIIFVLHLLHFTYKLIQKILAQRRNFIGDPWNIFDTMIMLMDWTVTGLYGFQMVLTSFTINAFHENKRKFVNFQQVMTIDLIAGSIISLSAFFGIIRFLKLLRFNRKIGMLTSVLKNSAKQWPGFFVMAAIFFIAFIHIGYLVFSPFMEDFKNILQSMETMLATVMGRPIYHRLRDLYHVFGPVFYFVYCFTAAFIIINVLIAIINESYGLTLKYVSSQNNEHEVIDFMIKRFVKWSGISKYNKEKKVRPAPMLPSEVPLPPLPYEFDPGESGQHVAKMQKEFDHYLFDLENKYSKYLTLEELRDEVIGEMENIPKRNDGVQNKIMRHRKIYAKKFDSLPGQSMSLEISKRTSARVQSSRTTEP